MGFGKKNDDRPKCGTCNGTGRITAAWVQSPSVRAPKHGNRHKATKRVSCPSCGGSGRG